MDPTIIAAIITAIATLAAVLISWYLHHRKTTDNKPKIVGSQTKEISINKAVDAYSRRYLEYPSHYRFLWSLPKLKDVVLENAQIGWDTGITSEMREASYDVIDFLEYSWLRIAQFYPKDHWGGKSAEAYIKEYIKERFKFHWSKNEPDGPGTGGVIVGILTGSDVIEDFQNLISDTVSALFMYKDDFEFIHWKNAWEGKESNAQQVV
jgi:hypothetical protein